MSQPSNPVPRLLTPPGPAVHSIRVLPNGQVTDSEVSTAHPPSPQLFHDAIVVRADVFVIGQNCSVALEIDADDAISWHWVIFAENNQKLEEPVATIRLVPAQAHPDADDKKAVDGPNYTGSILWDHKEPYVKIGRLATVKEFRGRGYAKALMEAALEYARKNRDVMVKDKRLGEWNGLVLIHAQRRLEGWYKSMGFETDEGLGIWWEESIDHVGMWKRVVHAQSKK